MGVYTVKAMHVVGSCFEMTGTDESKLMADVTTAAMKMELDIERKVSQRAAECEQKAANEKEPRATALRERAKRYRELASTLRSGRGG